MSFIRVEEAHICLRLSELGQKWRGTCGHLRICFEKEWKNEAIAKETWV